MTPAERRQAELDRIFAAGQSLAKTWPPLTDEQIQHIAFLINPRLAAPETQPAVPSTLPQAA